MFDSLVCNIQRIVASNIPRIDAHLKMAPVNRRHFKHLKTSNVLRDSAVLILLYPKKDDVCIVLIKRPEYDGPHGGQVSFPGGKFEVGDVTLAQTALRETHEELGVAESSIHIIGGLTSLEIPVSNYIVHPYIAYSNLCLNFKPDVFEVDEVIEVPIRMIVDDANKTFCTMNHSGVEFLVPAYMFNTSIVWGATAMILSEFESILKELDGL